MAWRCWQGWLRAAARRAAGTWALHAHDPPPKLHRPNQHTRRYIVPMGMIQGADVTVGKFIAHNLIPGEAGSPRSNMG